MFNVAKLNNKENKADPSSAVRGLEARLKNAEMRLTEQVELARLCVEEDEEGTTYKLSDHLGLKLTVDSGTYLNLLCGLELKLREEIEILEGKLTLIYAIANDCYSDICPKCGYEHEVPKLSDL